MTGGGDRRYVKDDGKGGFGRRRLSCTAAAGYEDDGNLLFVYNNILLAVGGVAHHPFCVDFDLEFEVEMAIGGGFPFGAYIAADFF